MSSLHSNIIQTYIYIGVHTRLIVNKNTEHKMMRYTRMTFTYM